MIKRTKFKPSTTEKWPWINDTRPPKRVEVLIKDHLQLNHTVRLKTICLIGSLETHLSKAKITTHWSKRSDKWEISNLHIKRIPASSTLEKGIFSISTVEQFYHMMLFRWIYVELFHLVKIKTSSIRSASICSLWAPKVKLLKALEPAQNVLIT